MSRPVRFPSDEELLEFMEEAVPAARKKAERNGLELEPWMVTEEICNICPELRECDQVSMENAVEKLITKLEVSYDSRTI